MCEAFGIVNYEGANVLVKGMQDYRPVAAFSFLGRYRMIDFPISNLSNSGVDRIQVYVKSNPRSLIEHLGTGRHYNINSKRGKLHILTAEDMSNNSVYNSDISAYMFNMQSIEDAPDPYVIITSSNMIFRANYEELLDQHVKSGADISILYKNVDNAKDAYIDCDVLMLNRQKGELSIDQNLGNYKNRAISCGTYILSKELFISLVKKAANTSSMYWFKDIINEECSELDIRGISLRGFFASSATSRATMMPTCHCWILTRRKICSIPTGRSIRVPTIRHRRSISMREAPCSPWYPMAAISRER